MALDAFLRPPWTLTATTVDTGAVTATSKGIIVSQYIDEGGTLRNPTRTFVNVTTTGSTLIVSTQGSGTKIRVLSQRMVLNASAAVITMRTSSTALAENWSFVAQGGINLGFNPMGHYQTNANEGLYFYCTGVSDTGINMGVGLVWVPTDQ